MEINVKSNNSCICDALNSSGIDSCTCKRPKVAEEKPALKNVAGDRTWTPYTSYLSEINVQPIGQEDIPTTRQLNMEAVNDFFKSVFDSDDDLYMWVDEPVTIDLISDNEASGTHDSGHGKMAGSETNFTNVKFDEVVEIDCPSVLPDLNNIPTPLTSLTSVEVNTSATGGSFGTEPPESSNIVNSSCSNLRILSVESISALPTTHADPLATSASSPVTSATSSEYIVDPPDHHVTVPGRPISQSESKDGDNHHAASKRSMSTSSERCDTVNRHKKRKLLASAPLYDAAAAVREHYQKRDASRQTFVTSSSAKSNSLTSKRDKKREPDFHRNTTYDDPRHFRPHSRSPNDSRHSVQGATHQRDTNINGKSSEGCRRRDSSVVQKSSSNTVMISHEKWTEISNDRNSNGSNLTRQHSPSAQNQRSSCDSNKATRIHQQSGSSNNQRSSLLTNAHSWESILITKQSCRSLLSTVNGYNLLNGAYEMYRVRIRMDWAKKYNTLWIRGNEAERTNFKRDLATFIEQGTVNVGVESQSTGRNVFDSQSTGSSVRQPSVSDDMDHNLPRNKHQLIKKIEYNLSRLKHYVGDVDRLFNTITAMEHLNSKNSRKRANRMRKELNMILLGKAGLKDGPIHLAALERYLKTLKNVNDDVINKTVVATIQEHFNKVFSPYKRDDYPALIAEYKKREISLVMANEPIEGAQETLTNITSETSKNSEESAQVIGGAQQVFTSNSAESSKDSDESVTILSD